MQNVNILKLQTLFTLGTLQRKISSHLGTKVNPSRISHASYLISRIELQVSGFNIK